MTTLEKIRAEIDGHCSENRDRNDGLYIAMKIIDKYAEQEQTDKSNLEKICEELAAENDDLRDRLQKQEPNLEKLKDKLHDKIEIHVCEVEENTLIAQGMLKALGMVDEVLENAEKGGE